jgi:hypothetical protein
MRPNPFAIVECWEQMHEAVLELATRCATPRQRLLAVAQSQFLAVAELGNDIRDAEIRAWIGRLTRQLHGTFNRPTRCSALRTINAMSDDDVDAALLEIVAFYDAVTRADLLERMQTAA